MGVILNGVASYKVFNLRLKNYTILNYKIIQTTKEMMVYLTYWVFLFFYKE